MIAMPFFPSEEVIHAVIDEGVLFSQVYMYQHTFRMYVHKLSCDLTNVVSLSS